MIKKILLLLSTLIIFTSCAKASEPEVDLTSAEWFYAVGSQKDEISQTDSYNFKKIDDLTGLEKYLTGNEGFIWLKTTFKCDNSKNYRVFLGRITMADKTYFNGNLIGETGSYPPDYFSEWNKNRLYQINKTLLREENVLLIKIYVNAEGAVQGPIGLYNPTVGDSIYEKNEFLNSYFNIFIAFLMFMIAGYHMLIYINRTKDKENLYYSLLSVFFVIYLHNFFITQLPYFDSLSISYLTFQKIIFASMFLMTLMTIIFFQKFLKREENKIIQYILILLCITPIAIIMFPSDYRTFFNIRFLITVVFSILPLLYIIVLLLISAIRKVESSRSLLLGTVPLFFCVFFDLIVHVVYKYDDMIYLAGFGLPSFMIVMAAILAKRFVTYHNEVEEYKETLEIKVEQRTEELNKRNSELEEAQNIMTRDMIMAENVQKNLFPKENIPDEDWDLAYAFKPMAGVSGDMYDFYENNGKLTGLGLFDVSGHGIASGLITLLSKTVIQRYFNSMYNEKLNKVMEKINSSLISQLGNVDNYLTGILLRIRSNIIEYVNAGHTELLYKSGKTGKVRVVNLNGKDVKGMFLGIEGMQSKYTALQFEMEKDDVLLLYSDCLNESMNSEGNEYSIEKIIEVLENCENVSAQNIRNEIIKDFADFIWPDVEKNDLFITNFLSGKGGFNLNDDFTMVVLKKE